MNAKAIYAIILAGGKGERLWPLSRENKPKQLLPFIGNQSLLETTLARLDSFINKEHRYIVTTQQQQQEIQSLVGNNINSLLIEPATRNTAPAILLSCLQMQKNNPDAMLVFLPADPYVPDAKKFIESLKKAVDVSVQHSCITLLGVKPTFPATGYGYIEYHTNSDHAYGSVIKFHEKPNFQTASQYSTMPSMLWNIGIFCGPVSVFIEEYKKHAPKLYADMKTFFETNNEQEYAKLPSISIDHAIMEKSNDIHVVPVDFEWYDVGNLESFLTLQQKAHKTAVQQNTITLEARDNLVSSPLLTVLIGVDDVCVVQTKDVLLIVKRDDVEKVKLVVQELKKKNFDRYL